VWHSPALSDPERSQRNELAETRLATRPPAPSRPPIIVRDRDLPDLIAAAFDALMTTPRAAGALLQEIERATVVTSKREWQGVAVPGSKVLYREGFVGPPRWTKLVMPGMDDGTRGTLSVLSPAGSGLLGLSIGQTISWEDRLGGVMRLELVNVSHSENDRVEP
jgi:regulator of nucleoside diphosphate kinase